MADALGIRAAVAVYPGDETLFFDRTRGRRRDVTLKDVLPGDLTGIGTLAMRPGVADIRANQGRIPRLR